MLRRRRALPSSAAEIVYPLAEGLWAFGFALFAFQGPREDVVDVDIGDCALGDLACFVYDLSGLEFDRAEGVFFLWASELAPEVPRDEVDEVCWRTPLIAARYVY